MSQYPLIPADASPAEGVTLVTLLAENREKGIDFLSQQQLPPSIKAFVRSKLEHLVYTIERKRIT